MRILNATTRAYETLKSSTLQSRLKASKVVLFGEYHHNLRILGAEKQFLEHLADNTGQLAVVFEMFNYLQQPAVDQYCRPREGERTLPLDEFSRKYRRSSEGFDLKKHYSQLLDACKERPNVHAITGFPPREVAQKFVREPDQIMEYLKMEFEFDPEASIPGSQAHFKHFQKLILGRPPKINEKDKYSHIFPAQALKESMMAWRINQIMDHNSKFYERWKFPPIDRTLVICGFGHVQYDFGVPERLDQYVPRKDQLVIACTEGDPLAALKDAEAAAQRENPDRKKPWADYCFNSYADPDDPDHEENLRLQKALADKAAENAKKVPVRTTRRRKKKTAEEE